MKNILVTGGCGFIGSNFILSLLEKVRDKNIVNLDILSYAANPSALQKYEKSSHYRFVKGDISDRTLVSRILEEFSIDTVVHFAAESHVDRSIHSPVDFIRTNIVGTYTLVDSCRLYWGDNFSGKKFIHISTDEVYGSISEGFANESFPYSPSSPYSSSKASSDLIVKSYHKTYGMPIIVTNCSNNYGPRQFPEKLLPLTITRALQNLSIPIYGDGLQKRDWIHVMDHVKAIELLLDRGTLGESYNIGGNADITNLDIVRLVLEELARQKKLDISSLKQLIQHTEDRMGHDVRYAIDHSKITSELGWEPSVPLERGIEDTVAWYVKEG